MFNETGYLSGANPAPVDPADTSCGPGRQLRGTACVCLPGSEWYGTNQCVTTPAAIARGVPTGPAPRSPADLAACRAYVEKYQRIFGVRPNVWCANLPDGYPTPAPPVVPIIPTPVTPPTTPPISTSPTYRRHRRHRPVAPRVVEQPTGELCPARGWVSRPIPGVAEYQTVACTPGRPVVIDPGLAQVVRQEALARHGLSGLDDLFDGITVGNILIPTWAIAAGVGLVAFMFIRRKRR